MVRACAFLRGINVGGKNLLPMADLRRFATELGLLDPTTILQSGNLVFRAGARDVAKVPASLGEAIAKARGFRPDIVVRTAADIERALARNPFRDRALADPSHVLVMFLSGPAPAGAAERIASLSAAGEQFALIDREVFLDYPNGIGRARVALNKVEAASGVPGTTRNVATLAKVLQAAGE